MMVQVGTPILPLIKRPRRLNSRSRLRLVLDDHASVDQPAASLIGQVEGKRPPLLRGHLRQALRDRAGDVDLLTILPFLWLPARQPSQRRVGVGRVMLDI